MVRDNIIKSAALALLPLVLIGHPRADEPKVITLSCEGTLTPTYGANKPEAPQPLQKTGTIRPLFGSRACAAMTDSSSDVS
jgi:hypothetical protein